MMLNDTIIQWSPRCRPYDEFVARYAKHFGLTVKRYGPVDSAFRAFGEIKKARMVFIWNGLQGGSAIIADACRRRGIPHVFFEWGMLPQKATFFLDLDGFCGRSMLNRSLQWVGPRDMARLHRVRGDLQTRYPLSDEGFALLPFQIHNDTQIIFNSTYQDMLQFAQHVRRTFPGQPIRVRPHPKSGNKTVPPGFEGAEGGDFLAWAARASSVVGITSTCLWEAAILGKPVLAMGDHALRTHAMDVDRACAAALALRVRRDGDCLPILERFGMRPLGCNPVSLDTVGLVTAENDALEHQPLPPPVPEAEPEFVEA